MTSTVRAVPEAATTRPHPLEPLSAAEIEATSKSIVAAAGLRPSARFVYVSLYEPAKAEVVAFEAGGPAPERLVKVVIRERAERATYVGILAANHSELRYWRCCRPLSFVRSSPDDNGYARPVEGLVTLVDLDTMTIVDVEDHGVVPLPTSAANYSAEALTAPGNVPVF